MAARGLLLQASRALRPSAPLASWSAYIRPLSSGTLMSVRHFATSSPMMLPKYAEAEAPASTEDVVPPPELIPPSSEFPPPPPTRTCLSAKDKPLVWIDCEMTGLDPDKNSILEIAVIITDGDLVPTDSGLSYTIFTEASELEKMDEWCRKTHAETGLTAACQDPSRSVTLAQAEAGVRKYIADRVERPKIANLAGSSVHFDLRFMMRSLPSVVDYLHYRIVDVSSLFEVCRRWFPKPLWEWSQQDKARWSDPKHGSMHRAITDIRYSIRQLEWYRKAILTGSPK